MESPNFSIYFLEITLVPVLPNLRLFIDGMNKRANDRYLAIEIECLHKFRKNMSNSITPLGLEWGRAGPIPLEISRSVLHRAIYFVSGLKCLQLKLVSEVLSV